jgi:uncharacterized membrane protein YhaH (DUF805 family)
MSLPRFMRLRGRVGRRDYLISSAVLVALAIGFILLVAIITVLGRALRLPDSPVLALALLPPILLFAVLGPVCLATQRFRDAGLNAWLAVPVWWLVGFAMSKVTPDQTWLTGLSALLMVLAPAIFPTAEESASRHGVRPARTGVVEGGPSRSRFGLKNA